MKPEVSIIIPCYNQAHYLPEAVGSVVNQTLTHWECIIVNDGSGDNTPRIANSLIMQYSEKQIRLINQENKGLAEARNAGINASNGKYILPLDADDLIHPEMLQKTVSLLKTHTEIAIAYTDVKHFGSANRIVCAGEYDFKRLCFQNHLNYCSLYRREAWESVGGYNPNMTWGYEDWDFWVSCGEKGFLGKRFSEPLFMYRVKETSMYTKALEHHSELMAQIITNHPNLYDQKYILEANKILEQCSTEGSKTAPMVSVIVPTYNRPDTLKRALESIAAQAYKRIEVIVINDAGEDVSGIISAFRGQLPVKYLIHNENKGLAAARNTAIKNASGQYIAYLDDDDILYPDHLETLVTFLETTNYKVAYTDAYRAHQEKENGKYVTKKRDVPYSFDFDYDLILTGNFIPVLCIMHEKSCIEKVGTFDETLRSHEDWDLWMKMSREFQFAHIKKITCEFSWRQDGSTMTVGKKDEMDYTRNVVLQRGKLYQEKQIKKSVTINTVDQRSKNNVVNNESLQSFTELFNTAEDLFRNGAYNEAIDAYKKVIELNSDDASVYNNLGVLYFKKNMRNDARVCFEKALSLDAHYKEAQQNLKKVSRILGDDSRATSDRIDDVKFFETEFNESDTKQNIDAQENYRQSDDTSISD